MSEYRHLRRPRYVSSTTTDYPQSQLEAKIVILGTQRVGKTSLVERYTNGVFSSNCTASTIGASFLTKSCYFRRMSVDKTRVRLQIWDTAGQERFRSMTPIYYRGAHAAIIVYDITNYDSFLQVQSWLKELIENLNQNILIAVVGSKSDLSPSYRKVDFNHAKEKIKEWTCDYCQNFVEFIKDDLTQQSQPAQSPQSPPNVQRSRSRSTSSSIIRSFSDNSNTFDTTDNSDFQGASLIDEVTLVEVSAKDDSGINDLFLYITRKLLESKVRITKEQATRHRESIFLTSSMGDGSVMSDSNLVQSSTSMSRAPSSNNSWSCC
ncbi:P-loop containing nucleoside triphosphate hydrolase protein [Wallemia mellicola]|nr:P-loop containing nucleoside triphosphate hydrolase protein [Wallemia mellicola]